MLFTINFNVDQHRASDLERHTAGDIGQDTGPKVILQLASSSQGGLKKAGSSSGNSWMKQSRLKAPWRWALISRCCQGRRRDLPPSDFSMCQTGGGLPQTTRRQSKRRDTTESRIHLFFEEVVSTLADRRFKMPLLYCQAGRGMCHHTRLSSLALSPYR